MEVPFSAILKPLYRKGSLAFNDLQSWLQRQDSQHVSHLHPAHCSQRGSNTSKAPAPHNAERIDFVDDYTTHSKGNSNSA